MDLAPSRAWRVAATLLGVAMLVSCGSPAQSSDGVASLADASSADSSADSTTTTTITIQDAAVQYAQCMRDEGVDIPDPEVFSSGDGGGVGGSTRQEIHVDSGSGATGGIGPAVDPQSEEFKAADVKCKPIMDAAAGQIDIDPAVIAEQREEMLAFAACMREQGIDFPDPTFDDNGGMTVGPGPNSASDSEHDSEAFQAANEACAEFMGGGSFSVAAPVGG
jgi:hypothetical protein